MACCKNALIASLYSGPIPHDCGLFEKSNVFRRNVVSRQERKIDSGVFLPFAIIELGLYRYSAI